MMSTSQNQNKPFLVYISCPASVSINYLLKIADYIRLLGAEVKFWNRMQTYNLEDTIRTCDAFLLITHDNSWNTFGRDLSPGCQKELRVALDSKREIFKAYKNTSLETNMYSTLIDSNCDFIEAVSGTKNILQKYISNHTFLNAASKNPCSEVIINQFITPKIIESRLLLL